MNSWSQLHAKYPYDGFNPWPKDEHGWNADSPVFDRLIKEVRPQTVVEVGVWKGASCLHMARLLRQHDLGKSRILAVDTWLGALEFWTRRDDPDRYQALKCVHGYPTVYYQFLSNVIHAGMQEVIIPFPSTSLIAARWFAAAGFKADLIYLDASHDRDDVYSDIKAWWENLRPGGILFGDDLGLFPGVGDAIMFAGYWLKMCYGLENALETEGPKWILRKPVMFIPDTLENAKKPMGFWMPND